MFIARQPIFNNKLDVYGYELLFRKSDKSLKFDGLSSLAATAGVVGGLYELGFSQIIDNKRAFVNFDADFLMRDISELIEPNKLIIEVLEDVLVDELLIERIKMLKAMGYKIALDDFVENYDVYPLVPYADIIKFDLMLTPLETIGPAVYKALMSKKILLAEKVETEAIFLKAKEMGFHLFQGFFFSKPMIIGKTSTNKSATKIQYARLLSELKKEEPSYQILAEIIEKDVSLAYKLMKVISSRSGDDLIYSIKRALTYMGLKEIERWISILMIQDLGGEKPEELMTLSLVRTRFAEKIAKHTNLRQYKHEASMMGLFSTLDAMLDEPMAEALKDISLPQSIKDVLIRKEGVLLPICSLINAYEMGDWAAAYKICHTFELDEAILLEDYIEAVKWAGETLKKMS
ncbi:EAL and HDOD domain-containing protein [Fusibacter sp. 3D3]|uniref:EAL and HDOD domain-containing protein n=1 Tax=Fusibacter sp. 3D3 TaxID=1048380 RepID=UPI000852CA07|nr:EAL domain-containing protein [Fusibacter sp. 3D3]GAU76839.1 predicted signal transduction protein [Fusibacter sp. 3D3]